MHGPQTAPHRGIFGTTLLESIFKSNHTSHLSEDTHKCAPLGSETTALTSAQVLEGGGLEANGRHQVETRILY